MTHTTDLQALARAVRRVPRRTEAGLDSVGEVVEGEDSEAFLALPTLGLVGARDFLAGAALSDKREGDFFDARLEAALGGE